MLKIKIKNFQSIKDATFEIDGFTVIVGKNNCGKSAIIRAIDAALSNRPGNDFIRWGENKTEVSITKDNLSIFWEKGETASYTIKTDKGEKTYTSLNKSVPQPVVDAGFKKFEIADEKLNPLIAHQFDELFLINRPGSFITEAISTIYDLNDISEADSICQKKTRSLKGLIKTRKTDLSSLRNNLEKFKGFDDIKKRWDEIKKVIEKSQDIQKEISIIESLASSLKSQLIIVERLKKIDLIKIPKIDDVEKKIADFQWISKIIKDRDHTQKVINNLKDIQAVKIPDTNRISDLIQEVSLVSSLTDRLKMLALYCYKCKKVMNDIGKHKQIVDKIKTTEEKISVFSSLLEISKSFTSQSEILKSLKNSYEKAFDDWMKVKEEFGKFKTCPLCNRPLSEF